MIVEVNFGLAVGGLALCFLCSAIFVFCFRRHVHEIDQELTELRRLYNDHEYYVDQLARKMNADIVNIRDKFGKLIKQDEFIELKHIAESQAEMITDVKDKVSHEMNADIFTLSFQVKKLEEKCSNLQKTVENYLQDDDTVVGKQIYPPVENRNGPPAKNGTKGASSGSKKKEKEIDSCKNLQNIQNNRLFEEILKYRGKILQIEKKDDEKNKRLGMLEDKLIALTKILDVKFEETVSDQVTNIDSGVSTTSRTLTGMTTAVHRESKRDGKLERKVFQESYIDVMASPVQTITFQPMSGSIYTDTARNSKDNVVVEQASQHSNNLPQSSNITEVHSRNISVTQTRANSNESFA